MDAWAKNPGKGRGDPAPEESYTIRMPALGRFAPSPTGILHLGNLRTALASWLSVKARGGKWLLRIEDVDRARSRPGWADEHLRDLASLGLESDGPILWQSRREGSYGVALRKLFEQGRLYPCTCTRRELASLASAPNQEDGLRPYPGTCREKSLAALEPGALRFRLPEGFVTWEDRVLGARRDCPAVLTGDPLLFRRDGCYAYHLAVVVDDAAQGVTEVVRGADLGLVTATQVALQEALGLPRPAYAHPGLVLDPSGARLGKRENSPGLETLKAKGHSLQTILGWLGWSLGCLDRPESCDVVDLVPRFRWDNVPRGEIRVPLDFV